MSLVPITATAASTALTANESDSKLSHKNPSEQAQKIARLTVLEVIVDCMKTRLHASFYNQYEHIKAFEIRLAIILDRRFGNISEKMFSISETIAERNCAIAEAICSTVEEHSHIFTPYIVLKNYEGSYRKAYYTRESEKPSSNIGNNITIVNDRTFSFFNELKDNYRFRRFESQPLNVYDMAHILCPQAWLKYDKRLLDTKNRVSSAVSALALSNAPIVDTIALYATGYDQNSFDHVSYEKTFFALLPHHLNEGLIEKLIQYQEKRQKQEQTTNPSQTQTLEKAEIENLVKSLHNQLFLRALEEFFGYNRNGFGSCRTFEVFIKEHEYFESITDPTKITDQILELILSSHNLFYLWWSTRH